MRYGIATYVPDARQHWHIPCYQALKRLFDWKRGSFDATDKQGGASDRRRVGIGKAAALLLAKEGAYVAAVGRTAGELQQVVREIEHAGGTGLMAVVADIARAEQMRQAAEQIIERWGRLDIVFANAGINGVWAPIEELEPGRVEQHAEH